MFRKNLSKVYLVKSSSFFNCNLFYFFGERVWGNYIKTKWKGCKMHAITREQINIGFFGAYVNVNDPSQAHWVQNGKYGTKFNILHSGQAGGN